MNREKILVFLLRLGGVLAVTAFLSMLMPTSWQASAHAWLGMGEFPDAPLTDYLTRSIAVLYGFHGCLLLLISTDVRRFAPLVTFVGVMNVTFGLVVIPIDVVAGMPAWWTWTEGPPVIAFGATVLYLRRSIPGE